MPDPSDSSEQTSQTAGLSRRRFVTRASLGAAAAGALVVAGPLGSRADAATETATATRTTRRTTALKAPVVAQVTDLASGRVEIFTGTRGVTVVDHDLAQKLAAAAGD